MAVQTRLGESPGKEIDEHDSTDRYRIRLTHWPNGSQWTFNCLKCGKTYSEGCKHTNNEGCIVPDNGKGATEKQARRLIEKHIEGCYIV